MMWLTWRQLRAQLAAALALTAALCVSLALTGPRLADLARRDATQVFDHLTRTDRDLFWIGIVVMALVPAVIGAFWGAPLVARELEHGTHRLIWNQTVTRRRWLAVKLATSVAATAAVVGVLSLAVTWWSHPVDGAVSTARGSLPSRLTPVAFAMRGVAPVGYAVFALVLAVTLGIVIGRSLPAMAVTLAVFAGIQVATPLWLRPHLLAPAHQTVTITTSRLDSIMANDSGKPGRLTVTTGNRGDWVLRNQTVDSHGRAVGLPSWMTTCLPGPPDPSSPPTRRTAPRSSIESCFTRLTAEGYEQQVTYQPASRFWALQWTETALFLGLSVLLAGFCFRQIRRVT